MLPIKTKDGIKGRHIEVEEEEEEEEEDDAEEGKEEQEEEEDGEETDKVKMIYFFTIMFIKRKRPYEK